jgi:small-conductance mechanosensitive channel
MVPLLQSLDGQSVISQRAPIGQTFRVAVEDLLAMTDRIVYIALAFNMFFGLLGLVLTRAIAGASPGRKKQVVL